MDSQFYEKFIKHHGILGQKWGVRNGPPYPLSKEQHSKSEIDAGWEKSLNKTSGLITKYALGKTNDSVKDFSSIKKIEGKHSREEDVKKINPKFGKERGTTMNCTMCSAAYEMRRRGYDVKAALSERGETTSKQMKWFNLSRRDIYTTKSYSDFKNKLSSMPSGSRGFLNSDCGRFHSRHCLVWEIVNGDLKIFDCQNGTIYQDLLDSPICVNTYTNYEIVRTDDKEISESAIKTAIRVA